MTIVFCDLKGSTSLGESLDPEALHEVKDRYFKAMAAEITRHGGKIEKYIGDAIMAVFGLPLPHEDDALRALRAAAGMQAALSKVNADLGTRYGISLTNRTGVNTGEVVANDDPTADQKLVTGDAVNVTARLEQAAPENQIYLGDTTYRLVRDAVEVESVEPLELKGKAERVPAYRLVSVHGLDGYARRENSPIVGREEELAAIGEALDEAARTRSARLVTIIGDAGMGKSRLAREVIAQASSRAGGAHVVRGRCLNYGEGIAFWPLRDIAGGAADIRFDDSPDAARAKLLATVGDADVAARLAAAIGLSDAIFPLHEFNWAARKFFETLAGNMPLVALIDDIHWADPAFLALMEHVLDCAENASILLLATSRHDLLEKRPDWGDRPASLRLILRPLTDASAARIAENLLGTTGLPPDIVKRIVDAAEGNPLYIEQILSMLVDSKALRQEDGHWMRGESYGEIAIPPTIKALLEARLGQLGREERTAIEPASVIGLQFAVPAVASLAPEQIRPDIGRHLSALARKQFVHLTPSADAEPIYRFHHHLVRDTVYGGLLKRARAVLHVDFVRWADQVNAERGRGLEFEEILGFHLEQAHRYLSELGPLDTKGLEIGRDGSRRLASAARRSFSRGDLHAARSLFARATTLLAEDDPERLPLLPETGEVLVELGEYADARTLADRAHAWADRVANARVQAAATLVRLLVKVHTGEAGGWSEVLAELEHKTVPMLEREGAHGEIAKAWRFVALVHQIAGRLGQASEVIPKIVAHARLAGDDRMVARSALGLSLSALYGPTPVIQAIEQCNALIADDLGDRQIQGVIMLKLAHLRAMNGEFQIARELYGDARALLRDLGQGLRLATASLDSGMVELLAGDAAAAERELRPDYDTLLAMGNSYSLSTMAALLARAVREQGRDEEALALTVTAESKTADDDVDSQVLWRCIRAPILARSGRVEEAEALVRTALDLSRQTDVPVLQANALYELAAVLGASGRIDEARDALEQAVRVSSAKGDTVSAVKALTALETLTK
ncbi:MAG: AAA family ATPase [Caldimonas sp.]